QDDRVAFTVHVQAEGDIGEKAGDPQRGISTEFIAAEEAVAARIERLVRAAVERMQALGADVADLGDLVRKRYPQVWREQGWDEEWTEAFRQAQFDVAVDLHLRRKGLTR